MDSEPQRNLADLPLVTFDSNALFALRSQGDAEAPAVREILEMNRAGLITANVTAMIAMEARREEDRLEGEDLIKWMESLGIARENILTHPRSIGFSVPEFPDGPTFAPWLEIAFAERLRTILHPNMACRWHEYRDREADAVHLTETQKRALRELDALRLGPLDLRARPMPGLDALGSGEREELEAFLKRLHRKWFNATNDAEGLRIHISMAGYTTHPELAVFVTSDKNFRKQTKLDALRAMNFPGEILRPTQAVAFLCSITRIPESSEAGS